jgi:hypothetical protein
MSRDRDLLRRRYTGRLYHNSTTHERLGMKIVQTSALDSFCYQDGHVNTGGNLTRVWRQSRTLSIMITTAWNVSSGLIIRYNALTNSR